MTRRGYRRGRGDDGTYLVLYALLAVAVFIVVALVLDIGLLRQDRRTSRLAADAAVTAGASKLIGGSAVAACTDAWGYFIANRPDSGGTVTDPDCAPAFAAPCDPTVTRPPAVGVAGDFRVEITNPVRNDDPLMQAEAPGGDRSQAVVASADGTDPCDRLAVRILRTRALAFAGIAGITSGRTDVHSVARASEPLPTGNAAAMVVLDATGCNALTTSGGGQLTATGLGIPGVITVDSSGAGADCLPGNAYTINPDNAGQIVATGGIIRSYAAYVNPLKAYDPADVAAGRLAPVPIPNSLQVGRTPVDDRYGVPIAGARLLYGVGAPGLVPYPDPLNPAETCDVANGTTLGPLVNRYVTCPVLRIAQGGRVTFTGPVVVFAGGITIDGGGQGGCLAFNSSLCGVPAAVAIDSLMFVRSGDILKGDHGQLGLGQATLLFDGIGTIDVRGGTGSSELRWTAPLAGPFEDLALWTETPAVVALSGQKAGLTIEGLLFAPATAEFLLRPEQPGASATAQVVARRVRVHGGNAAFVIGPDPLRAVQDVARSVKLIR